jgi:hypothetical protein
MATYNFAKSKAKDLSDTHTEMRLKDQHTKDAPETVTQQQLDKDYREGEQEVLTEKQLDKVRTGGAEVVIEKNLSDSKGQFGIKHRNPEASSGDINKVEEKRLSGKKVEDEKYKPASETPKQVRWWDNLKKAAANTAIKTAAKDDPAEGHEFDPDVSFGRIKDQSDEELFEGGEHTSELPEDLSALQEEEKEEVPSSTMMVTKNKEGKAPMPHINMELSFDPEEFGSDDEAIKEAALQKVLEVRPSLSGKIDVGDFSQVLYGPVESKVRLLLVGDEYLAPAEENAESLGSLITSAESEDVDVGGTPMTVGKVGLGESAETMDEDALLQAISDWLADKKGINVPLEAIQVNLEKKEATFAIDEEGKPAAGPATTSSIPSELTETDDMPEDTEDAGGIGDETGDEGEPLDEFEAQVASEANTPPNAPPVVEDPLKPKDEFNPVAQNDFPIVIADSKKK